MNNVSCDIKILSEKRTGENELYTQIKVHGGCKINIKSVFYDTIPLVDALKTGIHHSILSGRK